jgi:gliding motility-associated-like protein
MKKHFFTLNFVVLFCVFSSSETVLAQLGFCNGNSGPPVFTENFGTGTTSNALPAGTTTYSYINGSPNDGQYTVSNSTAFFDWHNIPDHTSGDTNGRCLIVNADFTPGEFYRTTVSGLCETTTYEFSSWLINLLPASGCGGSGIPINVRFEIWDNTNSVRLAFGNTGDIFGSNTPNWEEFALVFKTSIAQTSVILKMINNGSGGCGNDLAIDDIVFKSCGDNITINDSENNDNITICSSQTPYSTALTVTPDNSVFSSHFYQWEESIDGITWTDIPLETTQSILLSGINTTSYYRAKVAESAVNLSNDSCIIASNIYQVIVTQLPAAPTVECWQATTINDATCSWEVTGNQTAQPSLECWETATFNNTTCSWEVTGTPPTQPTGLDCWETATFNNTSCAWEVTGNQPTQPTLECWETTSFNSTTCLWETTGTQPTQPTGLDCWETATFNNTSCAWEVTGNQPTQPTLECWETTSFNSTTCSWETTGTQPTQPTGLECWETATFNNTTCAWGVTGNQPTQPTLECWETTSFNSTTCAWETTGTQPTQPTGLECWETATFNNTTCTWEVTGTQPTQPTGLECWETATFNTSTCVWEIIGEQPIIETISSDGNSIVIITSNIGDFLYSLDGIIFQSDNIFYNVEGGLYTIYIKARNCNDFITIEYHHFYIPQFFTPNNDGVNDTFIIKGIENYTTYEVSIYNRFGKILKRAVNTSFSWNGTYNNNPLPSTDYWYVIIIEGQRHVGHFTLKR